MDRHSPDLESHVSGVWRNCHILPVPNTYTCGSSRPYLAPAEQVGLVIDTGTESGNRQIDNQQEGECVGLCRPPVFPWLTGAWGQCSVKGHSRVCLWPLSPLLLSTVSHLSGLLEFCWSPKDPGAKVFILDFESSR